MHIKKFIKKMILREKYDSQSYIIYLRSLGIQIGHDCVIYEPTNTCIDTTRPWLVSIGNNVQITRGVTILTHGYDWSVIKGVYGEVLGSSGEVKIGDNVFIGMQSTILKGTHIGDNVIIGANSLVNKDIPSNCVAAGNPCRFIMSLDEYYMKRKEAQANEAIELVRLYRSRYNREPDEWALREFFWLFSNNVNELHEEWKAVNELTGNEEYSNNIMEKHKKLYNNMEEFLNSIPK